MIFFEVEGEFGAIEDFVRECAARYDLELARYGVGFAEGLRRYIAAEAQLVPGAGQSPPL